MRDQFSRSPINRPVVPAPSMNPDKQNNNGMPAKPFKPSLSAAFRTANKPYSPLTPRLAPTGGYQTPKKPASPDTAPPSLTKRDDTSTSASTPLSCNVTPRSGTRISRRDGPIASPETTPVVVHTAPQLPRPTLPVATGYARAERSPVRGGLGLRPEVAKSTIAKSISTDALSLRAPSVAHSSSESLSGSPKFFRAGDARSSAGSHDADSRPCSFSKQSQSSNFLYADGTLDTDSQTDDSNRVGSTKRRSTGSSSRLPVGVKGQTVLSPRLRPAQLADTTSRSSPDSNLQPSPNIEESFEARLSTSFSVTSPSPAQQPLPQPLPQPQPQPLPRPNHRKSTSLGSITQVVSPRGVTRRVTPISSPPLLAEALGVTPEQSPHPSPQIITNILVDPVSDHNIPYTVPQSPVKLEGPNAFGDGALNARTERKILDLEISNSSLLAINRTLERELRKQNAELRRFRRLSRSGRLSMTTSIRSISGGALSVVSEAGDTSELSSIHSNDELSEESDNDSFADDTTNSPGSLADHDARHRVSDEKRFMLDLAKHQELLVDSQKLNQSLKRCLGLTEELIKEGKRALDYNVHVNDVEVGGRVLAPEEIADELASGRGLLSPGAEIDEALAFDVSGDDLSPASSPDPM
ncbi:hypothetical protein BGW36DRAFT_390221 [Talaromyces proteolyticus]|uniref:Uncharacterized protein n=1 Tax=Talaromyces proteolyticus TaxID=1131652 RepID=A0AAD4KE57_9EURO|nr:uncharacterized protein BGW36DRAFT_390221 [Talaromyces proteolyticus]KAH8690107.1 hypothetical protein BGW36DRAFT_390221 [Talaromyces proteolyticus]